jgi:hypothetical protein
LRSAPRSSPTPRTAPPMAKQPRIGRPPRDGKASSESRQAPGDCRRAQGVGAARVERRQDAQRVAAIDRERKVQPMTEHSEYDRPDPPVLATRIVVMRDSDDSILWIAYNADGSTHGYGPVDLGDRLEERVLADRGRVRRQLRCGPHGDRSDSLAPPTPHNHTRPARAHPPRRERHVEAAQQAVLHRRHDTPGPAIGISTGRAWIGAGGGTSAQTVCQPRNPHSQGDAAS